MTRVVVIDATGYICSASVLWPVRAEIVYLSPSVIFKQDTMMFLFFLIHKPWPVALYNAITYTIIKNPNALPAKHYFVVARS